MILLLLLVFLPFSCFSIDFRSNNYRAIFNSLNNNNNVVTSIDPNILNRQIENNPYSEIFGQNQKSTESLFPIAELWKATETTTISFTLPPPTTTTPRTTASTSTTPTPFTPTTASTSPKTTPTVWTTSKSTPLKLSRNPKPSKSPNDSTAQLSVLSHRLLNDILIIPSSRKLYILAILPIHQSSSNHQSFECGEIDVNSIIRLSAFLEALKEINQSKMLKEIGAEIGAIVVDSCSTDLRSVADLYELLSGTNIQKSDLIAIIRDDHSYMPNTEEIMKQLRIPVINTYFSANKLVQTTGVLPLINSPIRAIVDTLKYYQSTCVNLIFDKKFEEAAYDFQKIAYESGLCVEAFLEMKNTTSQEGEHIIRRLLLSEARIVISLLTEDNWIQITKALRAEMVISARFVFLSLADQRWSTSRKFVENWPTFEQNMIAIGAKNEKNEEELQKLTNSIPKLELPNVWLKQFWASAFKCHLDSFDETTSNHKFSRECEKSQKLNISQIAPDVDISSISVATHSLSIAFRGFVDKNCPGALVISLNDCINDPFDAFYQSIMDLNFIHHLSPSSVKYNQTTSYRDVPLQISRVQFEDDRLHFSEIGVWNSAQGYRDSTEFATNKQNTSRGSYLLMSSSCQKSKCSQEMAKRSVKQKVPSILKALTDIEILIFTIFAVLSCLTCLMCMYLKFISTCDYRHCTSLCFLGLALLSLSSISFIIPPNNISCQLRQLLFPISISITISPVLIKTLLLWKFRNSEISSTSAILSSIAFIAIQTVISTEWVLLSTSESSTEFVSTIHGTMWRCSNGDSSESTILISCSLSAIMSILSVIFSLASLKEGQSLQHLMISIIAILFETSLYVSLPLLSYKTRDLVMATTILIFSFVTLLVSHLNRSTDKQESQTGGSIKKNENWLQHVQHYHTASTNPHSTIQLEKKIQIQRTNGSLYGSEAYELPPNATYG